MANSNPVAVGQIISAKIRSSKIDGVWQPPKLILSVVREIAPDAETRQLVVFCNDVFCELPSIDGGNQVHSGLGIGPRIALPAFIKKADPEKSGSMFSKAKAFDETAGQYTNVEAKPQFTKLVDGHRVDAEFADADRIEVRLRAEFDVVKKYTSRVLQTRDKNADNGWRQAKPWRSRYCRAIEVNGEVIDAPVEYISVVPTSDIYLDRSPRKLEASMKATEVGEML
jgi:hypothetical protein